MSEQKRPESVIVLNSADNVAVARLPIVAGSEIVVAGQPITVRETLTPGQKLAIRPIASGERVYKYGEIIGQATTEIAAGDWVHTHNVEPDFSGKEYQFATMTPVTEYFTPEEAGTFDGYLRENGDVGTRNYIAVIATSNCSSHVTVEIAERLRHVTMETHGVDGVVAIPHQEGCGHTQRLTLQRVRASS